MPATALQRKVAAIALEAGQPWGFALAGAVALMEHGLIDRPTEDVDAFSPRDRAAKDGAGAVEAALRAAGLAVERVDKTGGLSDLFYGLEDDLAEWVITVPGSGEQCVLQLAHWRRGHAPVNMAIGPVLHIEDAIGGKAHACAARAQVRDFLDLAAILHQLPYTTAQVIAFAKRLDPDLTDEEFAEAGQRLDRMPDRAFSRFGLGPDDVAQLRQQFTDWPRSAPGAGGG
jgi:hypothetical protein